MRTNRMLGAGLASLGGLIIVYAVLGPLVLDVIRFRTSLSVDFRTLRFGYAA